MIQRNLKGEALLSREHRNDNSALVAQLSYDALGSLEDALLNAHMSPHLQEWVRPENVPLGEPFAYLGDFF
jgi:hypothetical protein